MITEFRSNAALLQRSDRRRTRLSSHPLKLYFNLGLRVTVNTDNRLVTDTTVSKELWLCHTQMGMSFRDIKSVIMAGFKSSFLPFHERHGYLRRVGQELSRFDDDGNARAPTSVGSMTTSSQPTVQAAERAAAPAATSPSMSVKN
jgi:adenosine deaminase